MHVPLSLLWLKTSCFTDELEELLKREKEMGITPDPELDAYMRAEIRTGNRESIVTDLIIKMLGLDVSLCHLSPEYSGCMQDKTCPACTMLIMSQKA